MTKKNTPNKICIGCRSYILDKHRRVCDIEEPFVSKTEKCPCIDCLIKSMCRKPCGDFKSYRSKYLRQWLRYG